MRHILFQAIRSYPLASVICLYAVMAAALSPQAYLQMVLFYAQQAVVVPVLVLLLLPIAAMRLQPTAPASFVLQVIRARGVMLVGTLGLLCIGLAAFTTLKLSIPQLLPFYADPFLADVDAWLHLGEPGLLLHRLVPAWAQYPIGYLYGPVWFVLWFGLIAFVALQPDQQLRQHYFWVMALSIGLLGTLCAIAFSSVGPVFYDQFYAPPRFAALMLAIDGSAIGDYMGQASGYLLWTYRESAANFGTGISAMPSMHLAIATLNACMLASFNRALAGVGWIYVALIQLGSVYLGWHYAIDGYFSIVAVALLWWSVGWLMQRHRYGRPIAARPVLQPA